MRGSADGKAFGKEAASMTEFGNYLIPCVIGLILVFGLVRRVPLFDTFLEGAKEGAKSTFGIIPALVG